MSDVYAESVVAYVDILGFKNILRSEDKADILLGLLTDLSVNTSPRSAIERKQVSSNESSIIVKPAVNMFSDSMIISVSSKDIIHFYEWGNCIYAILSYVSQLAGYLILWDNGLLLRGGVAIGKLYHQDGIFFGQGLVDAYNLESSEDTKYPAVRVDPSVVERFGKTYTYGKEPGFFLQEDDDNFYIDIFSRHYAHIKKYEGNFIIDMVNKIDEQIELINKGILPKYKKEEILLKWRWYQGYAKNWLKDNSINLQLQ